MSLLELNSKTVLQRDLAKLDRYLKQAEDELVTLEFDLKQKTELIDSFKGKRESVVLKMKKLGYL